MGLACKDACIMKSACSACKSRVQTFLELVHLRCSEGSLPWSLLSTYLPRWGPDPAQDRLLEQRCSPALQLVWQRGLHRPGVLFLAHESASNVPCMAQETSSLDTLWGNSTEQLPTVLCQWCLAEFMPLTKSSWEPHWQASMEHVAGYTVVWQIKIGIPTIIHWHNFPPPLAIAAGWRIKTLLCNFQRPVRRNSSDWALYQLPVVLSCFQPFKFCITQWLLLER